MHRLFEDEFWGKCRPQTDDDYDFITSARETWAIGAKNDESRTRTRSQIWSSCTIIEFMTSAFSKTFDFGVFARPHGSTLEGVFESLCFRGSRCPFSIVLVWTIGGNVYKSMRFQTKTADWCGRGLTNTNRCEVQISLRHSIQQFLCWRSRKINIKCSLLMSKMKCLFWNIHVFCQ